MEYITPVNNYVVVEPSGYMKGFQELEDARGFVSSLNLDNILENTKTGKHAIADMYQEQDQKDLGIITGVEEGECRIYNLDSLIEKVRETRYFESEKQDIISKLLDEDIKLNVYDSGIEEVLTDVTVEWSI